MTPHTAHPFAYTLLFAVFVLSAATFVFAENDARVGRAPREDRIEGQYIVVFNDSVADPDAAEEEITTRLRGEHLNTYRYALRGFSARLSEEAVSELEGDSRVAFISEDRFVSITDRNSLRAGIERRNSAEPRREEDERAEEADIEAQRTSSSGRRSRGTPPAPPVVTVAPPAQVSTQILPKGIDRINAENKANKGAGIHVAVIDTGIATNHPDLKANIAGGKNCSSGGSTNYNDGNGHGTHVAGTIAALDNTFGVVGVAPEARLWAVRVLDNNGTGTWSSVICGLDFVASKGPLNGGTITVANLSLGSGGASDNNCGYNNRDALHQAVCRVRDAGVTIVVAAGNSGKSTTQFVPAAYDDAVITVSALADSNGASGGGGAGTLYGADDTFASFSNWGASVDIGAPGVSIYSTWLNNDYKSLSGTSMASPHVAGAAALYLATHPDALWSEVRQALIQSGELNGAGHTDPSKNHPEPVVRADTL